MGNFGIKNISKTSKIGLAEYFSYGLGDFSFCFIYGAIGSYIVYFYTDIACISAATVGTIMLLSKIFDAFSDLVMGYIIEHVHSPLGKARPWLLWMSIPYAIGCILLFTVPNFSTTGRVIYAFVSYNLMATLIYTSMNVPYGVLASVMTNKQNERSVLSICRASTGALSVFIISSYAPEIVEKLGGGAAGWQRCFILVAIVSVVLFFLTFYGTKERIGEAAETHKPVKAKELSMLEGIKILSKNKYWFIMLLVNIFVTSMSALYGMNTYFAKYVLSTAGYNKTMMMGSTAASIIMPLLLIPVVRKIGKRNVALYGGVGMGLIGQIMLILTAEVSFPLLILSLTIRGMGVACVSATKFGMIADTIEYGEYKTGVRAEGFVYSAASFGVRVGSALATGIMGWVLGGFGYDGSLAVQSASAQTGIRIMFYYAPLVVFIALFVLLIFYHLDKEYDGIMNILKERKLS